MPTLYIFSVRHNCSWAAFDVSEIFTANRDSFKRIRPIYTYIGAQQKMDTCRAREKLFNLAHLKILFKYLVKNYLILHNLSSFLSHNHFFTLYSTYWMFCDVIKRKHFTEKPPFPFCFRYHLGLTFCNTKQFIMLAGIYKLTVFIEDNEEICIICCLCFYKVNYIVRQHKCKQDLTSPPRFLSTTEKSL